MLEIRDFTRLEGGPRSTSDAFLPSRTVHTGQGGAESYLGGWTRSWHFGTLLSRGISTPVRRPPCSRIMKRSVPCPPLLTSILAAQVMVRSLICDPCHIPLCEFPCLTRLVPPSLRMRPLFQAPFRLFRISRLTAGTKRELRRLI